MVDNIWSSISTAYLEYIVDEGIEKAYSIFPGQNLYGGFGNKLKNWLPIGFYRSYTIAP